MSLNCFISNQMWTDRPDDAIYVPEDLRPIFMVLISITMAIGVVGNAMVILVILKTKNMFNSTNIFLSNLAIADLMVLLTWGYEAVFDVNHSPSTLTSFGESMCYGLPVVKDALTYASVLTILAIGVERYYAICQPLKAGYICTKKRAYWTCLGVWAVAVLSSSPQFLFTIFLRGNDLSFCTHDDEASHLRTLYYITTVSAYFFLPLTVLTTLYVIIYRHLKVAAAPNVNIAATRHRQHLVTMLAAVIICFFLCHLPYRVKVLLQVGMDHQPQEWVVIDTPQSSNLKMSNRILIFLHSAVNPILYNLMSKRFREGFKQLFYDLVQGCCRRQRRGCLGGGQQNQSNTAEHAV